MIFFRRLKWKNLLSTGAQFTEIDFTRSATTLIVGENGAGKSTMLDALCFVLYGKAFRNINRPQLISSINQKDCVVEVEFSIGKKDYKVTRGIKPAIFDIICDGTLIDQDAASKDYQSFLETTILKVNYRAFTQIVILGAASFTPFMQLPAAARREIIEDILDIKIFSEMNILLREKLSNLNTQLEVIETKIIVKKEKTLLQKNFIATLEDRNLKRKTMVSSQISEKQEELNLIEKNIRIVEGDINDTIEWLTKHPFDVSLNNFEKVYSKLENKVEKIDKDISFYKNNNNCPTCAQILAPDTKANAIAKHSHTKTELNAAISQAEVEISYLKNNVKIMQEKRQSVNSWTKMLNENTSAQRSIQKQIKEMETELNDSVDHDINSEKDNLRGMAAEVVALAQQKSLHNEEKKYLEVCSVLLKDTGIKTTIIKQHLPVINKLINKYLTIMDFFVHFELDEAFNESIKSRHRDEFSYSSFSEGEKQRINLALLFTWRQIAKTKNSVNTNLLILDEVFDSSLDNYGTEFVMQLLNTLAEDSNIFVISHKTDALADKFGSLIRFEKKNNFSLIV